MRFVKAFCLVALAALATMAFLGAGTASAQHKIVLCKELVTLCPAGKLWGKGTLIELLAKDPIWLSSLGTFLCEDSIVRGLTEQEIGDPFNFDSVTVEFGVLPTPTLGLGCTGTCGAATEDWFHATFENVRLLVEAVNKYSLLFAGLILLLKCQFGITCVYRVNHAKVPIAHDGTHPLHAGINLPLENVLVTLLRQTTHSGSSLCPAESIWHATYVLTLAKDHLGNEGLAWPSLDL
ncbi:MAG TPA: hypothetical protein VN752_07915 [Solirubrobacterales bacterium]|nr:hypothetical protein [Solirubrobacterales bacterium]